MKGVHLQLDLSPLGTLYKVRCWECGPEEKSTVTLLLLTVDLVFHPRACVSYS